MSGRHGKVRKLRFTAGTLALTAAFGTVATSAGTAVAMSGGATSGGAGTAAGASSRSASGRADRPVSATGFTVAESGHRPAVAVRVVRPAPATSPGTSAGRVEVRRKHRRITAEDVIRLARSQVRTHEDKSGRTKYQAWYVRTKRAAQTAKRDGGRPQGYRSAAWCDMFVSWVGDRTGTTSSMGSDAYTVAHAKWFKARHRWGYRPKAGAVVFFSWHGRTHDVDRIDHVGLVVKTVRHGTIQTIEGNSGNAVVMKNRPSSAVVGYGYPAYDR